jgi:hypothetical protein
MEAITIPPVVVKDPDKGEAIVLVTTGIMGVATNHLPRM